MTPEQPEIHSIALEFSRTPGPRTDAEGNFSGEEFLPKLLEWFDHARAGNKQLLVDLDGAAGYATSFLEAAFGGLARARGADVVRQILVLKSDDEPELISEVLEYIEDTKL